MAHLVDEHAELVFTWISVGSLFGDGDLHARYEVGLLWRGEPVLNPAITDSSPPGPEGFVTRFDGLTPGFVGGSDHDASFLNAFRRALTTSTRVSWEDLEPFTVVQFCPGGVDNLDAELKDWNRDQFDVLIFLTPAQLRHPPRAEWAIMGLSAAPALYATASREAAVAFSSISWTSTSRRSRPRTARGRKAGLICRVCSPASTARAAPCPTRPEPFAPFRGPQALVREWDRAGRLPRNQPSAAPVSPRPRRGAPP